MAKVVAYLRVSTDKQDVSNQKYGIMQYCRDNNMEVDMWVSDVITGSSDINTREFGEMFENLQKGDTLILSELSRITRSFWDMIDIVRQAMTKKVTLIALKERMTVSENMSEDDEKNIITVAMYGITSHLEKNRLRQRIKESMARRKKEGFHVGRKPGSKTKMEHRKLDPWKYDILEMLEKKIPQTVIAQRIGADRVTLYRYIKDLKQIYTVK